MTDEEFLAYLNRVFAELCKESMFTSDQVVEILIEELLFTTYCRLGELHARESE